jgi:HD-like signal output (HDOD) protein
LRGEHPKNPFNMAVNLPPRHTGAHLTGGATPSASGAAASRTTASGLAVAIPGRATATGLGAVQSLHARTTSAQTAAAAESLSRAVDQVGIDVVADPATLRRSLPDVAAQVLEMCSRTSVDAVGMEKTLTRDPFLSARVVSIANSAMFSPRMPILSVRDAVVRVGLDAVRDVVLMVVSNSTMFRVRGFEVQVDGMRRRMLGSAACARLLARAMRAEAEYGFLAGLLHNIGELVLLERCAQDGLVTPEQWDESPEGAVVREGILAHHAQVGAALCRAWKLPTGVSDAALYHHDYHAEGKNHLAAHLVAASDELAEYVLPGRPSPAMPPHELPATAELKLGPAEVKLIIEQARPVAAGLIASR